MDGEEAINLQEISVNSENDTKNDDESTQLLASASQHDPCLPEDTALCAVDAEDGYDINSSADNNTAKQLNEDNSGNMEDNTEEEVDTLIRRWASWDSRNSTEVLIKYYDLHAMESPMDPTILHLAARCNDHECLQLVLNDPYSLKPDINARDIVEATPLHYAVEADAMECAQYLLQEGADLNAVDSCKEEPVHYAARIGSERMIQMLFEKDEKDALHKKNSGGMTPLHIACYEGHGSTAKLLISMGSDVNTKSVNLRTPLHELVSHGLLQLINFVLSKGAEVDVKDSSGQTPLHDACRHGDLSVVKVLVEAGADIQCISEARMSSLAVAVANGHCDIVEYLVVNCKADMNCSALDCTVLHIAAKDTKLTDVLQILLKNGGQKIINQKEGSSWTALQRAADCGNIEALQLLLEYGATCEDRSFPGTFKNAADSGYADCCLSLLSHFPNMINVRYFNGGSLLNVSAKAGLYDVCKYLIDHGVEVSSRNDKDMSALDNAAAKGHTNILALLVNSGASVHAVGKLKRTPAHYASKFGHLKCVKFMIEKGSSFFDRDRNGKHALDLAVENFHQDACRAIIDSTWIRAPSNQFPVEEMIECTPSVFKEMLSKSIVEYGAEKTHEDYTIHYDFEWIEQTIKDSSDGRYYFGPAIMAKYHQDDLLCHPLCGRLIAEKWSKLFLWFYLPSMLFYMAFLAFLTTLVVHAKEEDIRGVSMSGSSTIAALAWITMLFAVVYNVIELMEMFWRRLNYIMDPTSWLEVTLFTSTFVFVVAVLYERYQGTALGHKTLKWQAGSVSILTAWSNMVLYLKRFPLVGLSVIMFMEVLKSVLSVLVVFVFFFIGFGLSFFVLLNWHNGFKNAGRSLVKGIAMGFGETDYDTIFTDNFGKPEMVNTEMAMVTFFVFLIVMPIVVTNLMIGLAVGDINEVRKTAYLRMLKMHALMIANIEQRSPFLRGKAYIGETVLYPNERSFMDRIHMSLKAYGQSSFWQDDVAESESKLREKSKQTEQDSSSFQETNALPPDVIKDELSHAEGPQDSARERYRKSAKPSGWGVDVYERGIDFSERRHQEFDNAHL